MVGHLVDRFHTGDVRAESALSQLLLELVLGLARAEDENRLRIANRHDDLVVVSRQVAGEAAVTRLLTGEKLPTAVLCSNDVTALGAIRALHKSGLRVPADVSVVGADDIPFAALAHPPLTTVRIPRERLGALALEILQEMLATPAKRGRESILPTNLVIRESTGPVSIAR